MRLKKKRKNLHYKLLITASKRNVFISVINQMNKVKKIITPGQILKRNVRREEYRKIDENKNRRKKRSLRMYINNQKKIRMAWLHATRYLRGYFYNADLTKQTVMVIIAGSNLRWGMEIIGRLIGKRWLKIVFIIAAPKLPHNGCPQKIKKRKKNKGRNKWKKLRQVRKVAKNPMKVNEGNLPKMPGLYHQKNFLSPRENLDERIENNWTYRNIWSRNYGVRLKDLYAKYNKGKPKLKRFRIKKKLKYLKRKHRRKKIKNYYN